MDVKSLYCSLNNIIHYIVHNMYTGRPIPELLEDLEILFNDGLDLVNTTYPLIQELLHFMKQIISNKIIRILIFG